MTLLRTRKKLFLFLFKKFLMYNFHYKQKLYLAFSHLKIKINISIYWFFMVRFFFKRIFYHIIIHDVSEVLHDMFGGKCFVEEDKSKNHFLPWLFRESYQTSIQYLTSLIIFVGKPQL